MVSLARKNLKVTFERYAIFAKVKNKAKGIIGFRKNTKVNKHDKTVEQQRYQTR